MNYEEKKRISLALLPIKTSYCSKYVPLISLICQSLAKNIFSNNNAFFFNCALIFELNRNIEVKDSIYNNSIPHILIATLKK